MEIFFSGLTVSYLLESVDLDKIMKFEDKNG
jgi:hypothetical protein